jgi:exosortase
LEDPDLSYGFLIPVVSAAILFANRKSLRTLPARKSLLGLVVLLGSIAIFFAGILSFTNILQRLAVCGTIVGAVWFVFGSAVFRSHAFPFFYLIVAIPPPLFLINPPRMALKTFVTRLSADSLSLFGYPVQAEGNILAIADHHLEVADACSGVRSLLATLSTAILFCYLFRTGYARGTLLILTAVPVTVAVNIIRIVVVAVALVSFDRDLTGGVAHDVTGFVVFSLGIAALYLSWCFYEWLFLWKPVEGQT